MQRGRLVVVPVRERHVFVPDTPIKPPIHSKASVKKMELITDTPQKQSSKQSCSACALQSKACAFALTLKLQRATLGRHQHPPCARQPSALGPTETQHKPTQSPKAQSPLPVPSTPNTERACERAAVLAHVLMNPHRTLQIRIAETTEGGGGRALDGVVHGEAQVVRHVPYLQCEMPAI